MAVGGEVSEFDKWLNNKLLEFNTDEGVFGSYIKGILEGEEPLDEKAQALEEILSEIIAENITKICQEILEKWKNFRAEEESNHKTVLDVSEDVDVKLAKLMESQAKATTVTRNNYTDEERRIREAILRQYGQMSDDDDDAETEGEKGSDNLKENRLVKNTNAAAVQQAEKEKREKAKIESQKKKEKDKEDREKQKQLAQEKKEKRKTQKGERRR